MDAELARIAELKGHRQKLDEEISKLTADAQAKFDAGVKGDKKSRKPRTPKQLSLVK